MFTNFNYSSIQHGLEELTSGKKNLKRAKIRKDLPSARHLIRYKNFVDQRCGFVKENLHWMQLEADRQNITVRHGVIAFDEMQIQVVLTAVIPIFVNPHL